MKSWIGLASMTGLACVLAGVACSGDEDNEQNTLPLSNMGGSAGSANAGSSGAGGSGASGGSAGNTATGGSAGQASGTGGRAATGGSSSVGGGGGMAGSGVGGTGTGGSSQVEPDAGGDPGPTANIGFVEDVYPIMTSRCATCHGTQGRGGHNIASPTINTAFADAQRIQDDLLGRIDGGGMPPGCNTVGTAACLTAAQIQLVSDWIEAGAPRNRTP